MYIDDKIIRLLFVKKRNWVNATTQILNLITAKSLFTDIFKFFDIKLYTNSTLDNKYILIPLWYLHIYIYTTVQGQCEQLRLLIF